MRTTICGVFLLQKARTQAGLRTVHDPTRWSGSGGILKYHGSDRVGSGRIGSGRIGSGVFFQNLTGRAKSPMNNPGENKFLSLTLY